ncbi:MAG: HNH endonuclease [Trichodesmium sp. MO_231.B1]|nr:HNH endonuclease [Trichodesmium sp. MO_231.B1]
MFFTFSQYSHLKNRKDEYKKDEYKNLQLLHRHCHHKKTASDGSLRGINSIKIIEQS